MKNEMRKKPKRVWLSLHEAQAIMRTLPAPERK
jgi:hypothetical protein